MKPLSDLDINRRVDFELLKRNMSRDQLIKNQEGLHRSTEMTNLISEKSEERVEDKKILMLMYESKERVFFPGQMVKKEELVKLYPKDDSIQLKDSYISIPILLSKRKLRLYDPENVFELENETNTLKFTRNDNSEYSEVELDEGCDSLVSFFETCLKNQVFKKVIILRLFLIYIIH